MIELLRFKPYLESNREAGHHKGASWDVFDANSRSTRLAREMRQLLPKVGLFPPTALRGMSRD